MKTMHHLSTIVVITLLFMLNFLSGLAGEPNQMSGLKEAYQPPQRRTPQEMAKRESDWMKTDLALTAEQLTKVDTINLKYAKKMRGIWEASQGNREEMQAKRGELDKQKRAELEAILSADQLKKYDESLATRRQRMQNRQGN